MSRYAAPRRLAEAHSFELSSIDGKAGPADALGRAVNLLAPPGARARAGSSQGRAMPVTRRGSAVAGLQAARGKQSDAEWPAVVVESAVVGASLDVRESGRGIGSSAGATVGAILRTCDHEGAIRMLQLRTGYFTGSPHRWRMTIETPHLLVNADAEKLAGLYSLIRASQF